MAAPIIVALTGAAVAANEDGTAKKLKPSAKNAANIAARIFFSLRLGLSPGYLPPISTMASMPLRLQMRNSTADDGPDLWRDWGEVELSRRHRCVTQRSWEND